jgi:hypothetical protein
MLGKCYLYALETLFDLHASLSTGTVTLGSHMGAVAFDQSATPHVAIAELGASPRLVHGPVLGDFGDLKDKKIGHAWIEGNGYVLDCGSREKEHVLVTRDYYYNYWRINPQECVHYTLHEVTQQVIATGRDFDWSPNGRPPGR